jgi:hypothetical protein
MGLSAFARLLYIGLWNEAFDDGVFEWKPLTIKARIFPVDNVDIAALLAELISGDCIRERGKYGLIRNFRHYQRPKKPNSSGMLEAADHQYVGIVPNHSPTSTEEAEQMEEGGGKGKDVEEAPLTPEGGDEAIFNECWQTFPHHPESVRSQARKQFDTLKADEKLELLPSTKHYRAFWVEECVRRKETQEARLQYVPHLATWIKNGAWREAMALPVKAAASAAVADALEYVDRYAQEDLFARCERLRGKAAPTSIQRYGFPREIVAAARAGEGVAA